MTLIFHTYTECKFQIGLPECVTPFESYYTPLCGRLRSCLPHKNVLRWTREDILYSPQCISPILISCIDLLSSATWVDSQWRNEPQWTEYIQILLNMFYFLTIDPWLPSLFSHWKQREAVQVVSFDETRWYCKTHKFCGYFILRIEKKQDFFRVLNSRIQIINC